MAKQRFYGFAPETGVSLQELEDGVPYLGDSEAVYGILAIFVNESIQKRLEPQSTVVGIKRFDRRACSRLARMFLGQRRPLAIPVQGWNKEGVIDEHIAKSRSIDEKSPLKRMACFFALLLKEVHEQIERAAEAEALPELYEPAIKMMVEVAAGELCGIEMADDEPIIQTNNTDDDDESAWAAAGGKQA